MSLVVLKRGAKKNDPQDVERVKSALEDVLGDEVDSFMLVGNYNEEGKHFAIAAGSAVDLIMALVAYLQEEPRFSAVLESALASHKSNSKLREKFESGASPEEIADFMAEELKAIIKEKVKTDAEEVKEDFSDYPVCPDCGHRHPTRDNINRASVKDRLNFVRWLLNNKKH